MARMPTSQIESAATMRYQVNAISSDHMMVQLAIDAPHEVDARLQVEARGMFVAQVRALQSGSLIAWLFGTLSLPAPRHRFSVLLFSQEMLALLQAGLSIVESLESLLEKEPAGPTRTVLGRLLAGVCEGRRLSSVLGDQPELFSPLYIGVIQAAEGTSDLPRTLGRFIDYQRRIDALRNKIVSAAIYPLILLFVGGGVALFLMVYVVPRFAQVYQSSGRDLPWMSRVLLGWGEFVAVHVASLLTACVLAFAFGFSALARLREQGMTNILAKFPGFGDRLRIYQLSRLYLTLGLLLEGGISIVPALETVLASVTPDIRKRLERARHAVETGVALSVAFETAGLATPISLRMMRVGERSGEMARMLAESAAFHDSEINRWIDRFLRSFEPLLMTAIGVVIGLIVVLLYIPIFDLAGSLT
jgi:general secretion pathway protein F